MLLVLSFYMIENVFNHIDLYTHLSYLKGCILFILKLYILWSEYLCFLIILPIH